MSKKGTEAIEKITVFKNAKALQRILGLFNFHRRFICQLCEEDRSHACVVEKRCIIYLVCRM